MNVFTAFSGYDSQCMALDRLRIDYDLVGWSEIDKYAIQAHNAIYPQYADRNLGDISKIDWNNVPDFDLFTMSSPCQDFSNAGQQKGGEEGSGTRSSLLWECRRAIIAKKPKYILFENVKALVQSKFIKGFNKWLIELESYGYTNYSKVLNAKDFGVPQNRERIFVVSILGDEHYEFPKGWKLDKCLKDILEEKVDDSYFLSQKIVDNFLRRNDLNKEKGNGFRFKVRNPQQTAKTILTAPGSRPYDNYVYGIKRLDNFLPNTPDKTGIMDCYNNSFKEDISPAILTTINSANNTFVKLKKEEPKEGYGIIQIGRGFNSGGIKDISPTITTSVFEQNNFVIGSMQKNAYKGSVNGVSPTLTSAMGMGGGQIPLIGAIRGRNPENPKSRQVGLPTEQMLEINKDGVSNTLTTVQKDNVLVNNFSIRKLTPTECFRLMGVCDKDINTLLNAGISKTQLYKMAGNSIVVDVLVEIFRNLFIEKPIKTTLF